VVSRPRSAAIRVFGPPVETASLAAPLGADFYDGGPLIQRNPPGYTRRPDLLRYEDVSILSTPTPYGVHSIVIADPTAATQKGVGIGDPLADAKAAYPGLECRPGQSNDEHAPPTRPTAQASSPTTGTSGSATTRSGSSRSPPPRWADPGGR
jgi:hypothetical protein